MAKPGDESLAKESYSIEEAYFDVVFGQSASEAEAAEASIRSQLADGLAVADGETRDMLLLQLKEEHTEQIINDALTHGRRTEEYLGEMTIKFTEIVPRPGGEPGDMLLRNGTETILLDGTREVQTYYFDPKSGLKYVGATTTHQRDGVETVVKVLGAVDLRPGDTRAVPEPVVTAAGPAPRTIDPKADGSQGFTQPPAPATPSGGTAHEASTPSGSTSPSSGTTQTDTSSLPPERGAATVDHATSGSSDPATSAKTDRSWDSHTPATAGGDGDSAEDVTSHTDEYQNSDGTYTYVTTTTTTNTATGETETHTETETTDEQRQHTADDGYSNTGTVEVPAPAFGSTEVSAGTSDAPMTYSGVFGTIQGTPIHAETGNPHAVGGDYGNPADAAAPPPPATTDVSPPSVDPLIHTEPEQTIEVGVLSTDAHDLQTSIHTGDFADPNDPLFGTSSTPVGHDPQDTSPYEHGTDGLAMGDDDGLP